jgi:hypothetical protein
MNVSGLTDRGGHQARCFVQAEFVQNGEEDASDVDKFACVSLAV